MAGWGHETKETKTKLWYLIEPVTVKVSVITHSLSNALVYSRLQMA